MRDCEVHPIDSLVISVNKDNVVEVWDYTAQECIMTKSLNDILATVPARGPPSSSQLQMTTKQHHAYLQTQGESIQHPTNNFLFTRQHKPFNSNVYSTFCSGDQIASALLSTQELEKQTRQQSENEAADRLRLQALQLQKVGFVKRATFIDREAIRWMCGIYSQTASKAAKSPLFSLSKDTTSPETSPFASMTTTFHTSQCIMLVCEAVIVFHDMQTKRSWAITTLDFGNTKAIPTCAEFICPELCAIGCSDGCVRIWDCLQWKLVKTLTTTTKSPIQTLKNLLPKNFFSQTGQEMLIKDGHSRMRLLSTQVDGGALIWESEVYGNMVLIGSSDHAGYLTTSSGRACVASFLTSSSSQSLPQSLTHTQLTTQSVTT